MNETDPPSALPGLLQIIPGLSARQDVLLEAVLQLIEQLVAPDPAASARFAAAIRSRLQSLLAGAADQPDPEADEQMTLVLAAILTSAGKPPPRA